MRNSFIIKEEFQKELIRILNLDTGCLPFFTIPREDGLVVLIVAVRWLFLLLTTYWFIKKLCFVLFLKVTGRPVTPHPPWDPSIHTCSDAQGKHELGRPRHHILWYLHTPICCIFSFCSDNLMHTYPLTRRKFRETVTHTCTNACVQPRVKKPVHPLLFTSGVFSNSCW